MNSALGCPNCKTNNSQFNIIHLDSRSAQIDPNTGEIINNYSNKDVDPFPYPYKGPQYQVQCAECGFVEEEEAFIQFGGQMS